MKSDRTHYSSLLTAALLTLSCHAPFASAAAPAANPAIDMSAFLAQSQAAAEHRASRRLSETDFLKLARDKNTIILDARSQAKFQQLHIDGAINLSFPDITVASLAELIPDKSTRILIYCNNNFRNAEAAFPTKLPAASLNLSTYIALYTYGYRNVYELGPQVDPKNSLLPLVGERD
jgi:phage shock protein E